MNNPFYYTPDAAAQAAIDCLVGWLQGGPSPFSGAPVAPAFRAEVDRGKMFGVLVVEAEGKEGAKPSLVHECPPTGPAPHAFLAAYSGQVCGRGDWQGFVPAVFDYLQPDGYFRRHEAEIVTLTHAMAEPKGQHAEPESPPEADDPHPAFTKGKRTDEGQDAYIRRRQHENAELHRWKLRQREREAAQEAAARQKADRRATLKRLRRQKSDDLQRWLFRHFQMRNGRGETKDLLEIWQAFGHPAPLQQGNHKPQTQNPNPQPAPLPPAGAGECCEPKLLQYAFAHGLRPVSMAMFWWGESPKNEVRHHLRCYPACNGKCKPILDWMLQGLEVDGNPLESQADDARLERLLKTIYEDGDICVVDKPTRMLSVPGKCGRTSVLSVMRRRWPTTDSPLIVHRLDMDTSGLLVIAKTLAAYHCLQRQFANHEIRKRYVALLCRPIKGAAPAPAHPSASTREGEGRADGGKISLPLRPDLDDRPRQMVDFEHGKEAVTRYKMVGDRRVWLWPLTGRTHQLRVHCAHRLGLGDPILGDRLYGNDDARTASQKATRLCLHAEELTLRHPSTGETMTFTAKAPF